jgi:hypothetical protein
VEPKIASCPFHLGKSLEKNAKNIYHTQNQNPFSNNFSSQQFQFSVTKSQFGKYDATHKI